MLFELCLVLIHVSCKPTNKRRMIKVSYSALMKHSVFPKCQAILFNISFKIFQIIAHVLSNHISEILYIDCPSIVVIINQLSSYLHPHFAKPIIILLQGTRWPIHPPPARSTFMVSIERATDLYQTCHHQRVFIQYSFTIIITLKYIELILSQIIHLRLPFSFQ